MTTKTLVNRDDLDYTNGYHVENYRAGGTDTQAVQAAVSAASSGGNVIFGPNRDYTITAGITGIWNGTRFRHLGGGSIIKAFNGDLFSVNGGYITFDHLVANLQGGTYTGAAIRFQANSSQCEVVGGRYENGADAIFLLEDSAASQSNFHDFFFSIHSSLVATGACLKRTSAIVDTVACPRHFHHIIGGGASWFANVDGLFSGYFDHVYSAGITLGDACLGCTVNNCRLAVPAGMTVHISGNSTLMQACEIGGGGDLTVDAGFVYGQFQGNVMDPSRTFTDNSIKTGIATQPLVEDPRLATGLQVLTLSTANLPAASAAMNGRIVIEETGANTCNLVVYKGGERFKVALTES